MAPPPVTTSTTSPRRASSVPSLVAANARCSPLNLLGDFGGGGMLLAFGVVSALLEARASGRGQVVDAAMVDGAPLLATLVYGLRAGGFWTDEPGIQLPGLRRALLRGVHGRRWRPHRRGRARAAVLPALLEVLEITAGGGRPQWDEERWPELKATPRRRLRHAHARRWAALLDVDACTTPVYTMAEAPQQAHMAARGTFVESTACCNPRRRRASAARPAR